MIGVAAAATTFVTEMLAGRLGSAAVLLAGTMLILAEIISSQVLLRGWR